MKTLLLSLACFFACQCALAQSPYYEVKVSTAPYQGINNPTWMEINPTVDYAVPSLSGFRVFGKELGTTMYVLKNGWVINYGQTNSFSMAPFLAYRGLYSRKDGSSMAAIGSLEPNGDTIIKIQWQNMGLVGNDSGDYANFQLWIYKKSQIIEFRYGPSRITDTIAFKGFTGPAVEIMLFDTNFSAVQEVHKLVHDPANPKDTSDAAGISSQMKGVPANGTVYTFVRKTAASVKENAAQQLSVYPNPVTSDVLFINTKTAIAHPGFMLVNTLGQNIPVENITAKNSGYELILPNSLQNGIYFLQLRDAENIYSAKIHVAR